MKKALIVLAVLVFSTSLGAQSLVELAKREKARRESFKGRHAVVITSRELLLVKKTGAVEVTRPEGELGDETGNAAGSGSGESVYDGGLVAPPPGSPAAAAGAGVNADDDIAEVGPALEEQLRKTDELIEGLTTEMNALRQQYEAQNTMVPGYVIQERMDELNQRLLRAQARQAKILEKLGRPPVKKEPGAGAR